MQLRADLGFGPSLLGALVATFFATSAVAALTAGMVVGRFGTSPVVRLSALVGATSMLAIAVAAQHRPVLVAALVLAGWATTSVSRRAPTSSPGP